MVGDQRRIARVTPASPALLGNIVGGVSLVAALAHGQIVGEKGGSEGKKGGESIDG